MRCRLPEISDFGNAYSFGRSYFIECNCRTYSSLDFTNLYAETFRDFDDFFIMRFNFFYINIRLSVIVVLAQKVKGRAFVFCERFSRLMGAPMSDSSATVLPVAFFIGLAGFYGEVTALLRSLLRFCGFVVFGVAFFLFKSEKLVRSITVLSASSENLLCWFRCCSCHLLVLCFECRRLLFVVRFRLSCLSRCRSLWSLRWL